MESFTEDEETLKGGQAGDFSETSDNFLLFQKWTSSGLQVSNFHRGRASPDKEKASSNWSLRTGKIVTGVSDKEWEAMGSIAT